MTGGERWPRVSVIIPVFGGAATLETALRSVRASDYPDYEIIAADDGSPDHSRQILDDAGVTVVATPRAGPAAARNRAVEVATGEILYFTDADVEIAPDTIRRGVRHFLDDPELTALFGSYTAEPGSDDFFTRYKNFVHHFTHQSARENAFTFWTGCGFVRRRVLLEVDGFDPEQRFLSDVEFGYRLHLAGHPVRIDPSIQVVHHKRYDLAGLLRSDFYGRAVPWSRLIKRHRMVRRDLNLRFRNVISVPLSFAVLLLFLAAPWLGWPAVAGALVGLGILAALNQPLLGFVRDRAGMWFAIRALLVQWVIYLISGVGVVAAALGFRSGGR